MAPLSFIVLSCSALLAIATATEVEQCEGKSYDQLSENVQLSPCKKLPCRLKKGTQQYITINFTPEKDYADIKNHVTANILGLAVPFIGVDSNSVCYKLFTESGEKAGCPVKAGTKYIYKDSFHVLNVYPSLNTKVHWALTGLGKEIICFEAPIRIQ